MIAAISGDILRTATATAEREPATYHWFKMPDLSRKTRREIGQSGAGWTFDTICGLVHHIGRVGKPQPKKAARELGRLGVGIKAIAFESGQSPNKVRRDLVKLVDLGLVAVSRRNVTFTADLGTGKIVENRTGRSLPVTVFLTIGPEHCRAKAGQEPAASPPRMEPLPVPDRVHPGTRIQREVFKRKPDGQTDGIGQPQARGQERRLEPVTEGATCQPADRVNGSETASQSPRQAGKAALEGGVLRMDAAEDGIPLPVGRISRPAGKPAQSPRTRNRHPEDCREPATWGGEFEAARLRMLQEVAERRQRDDQELRDQMVAGSLSPRQRALLRLPS